MDNTTKIVIAAVGIGIWYLLKDKIPDLTITNTSADAIEFKFNKAIRRIKKREQDSYEAGKYVLVVLSDNENINFTIYKADKIVKRIITQFKTT